MVNVFIYSSSINNLFLQQILNMKFFYTFFFLVCSLSVGAQHSFDFEFIGTIQTEDEHTMFYQIRFDTLSGGKLIGETVTDYFGEHSTVAKIQGTLANNLISFKELGNVSTNVTVDESSFCFLSVTKLPFIIKADKSIIKGAFVGEFPSGKPCVNGDLYLVGADYFKAKRAAMVQQMAKNNQRRKPKKTKEVDITLKSNETLTISCKGDELVTLAVWDNYQEDGDVINVFVNGELAHENFEIKQAKQHLAVNCENSPCAIKIVAVSEGAKPPNTVHGYLQVGKEIHPLITVLKKGESVMLNLTKN